MKRKWKFVGRIGNTLVWESDNDVYTVDRDEFWNTACRCDTETLLALVRLRRALEV